MKDQPERPDPHAMGLRMQFRDGQAFERRQIIEYLRWLRVGGVTLTDAIDRLEKGDDRK